MSDDPKDLESEINEFHQALDLILGPGTYPPAAIGDLSDLLFTLSKGIRILHRLKEFPGGGGGAELLQELEIFLQDEIRMILEDLVPSLTEMRRRAYELAGEEEE